MEEKIKKIQQILNRPDFESNIKEYTREIELLLDDTLVSYLERKNVIDSQAVDFAILHYKMKKYQKGDTSQEDQLGTIKRLQRSGHFVDFYPKKPPTLRESNSLEAVDKKPKNKHVIVKIKK